MLKKYQEQKEAPTSCNSKRAKTPLTKYDVFKMKTFNNNGDNDGISLSPFDLDVQRRSYVNPTRRLEA